MSESSTDRRFLPTPGAHSGHRSGLTLVEVLVVIAIIGLLVGLLIPAVNTAREGARRASCANNLKQFGIAIQKYESQFSAFPPATTGMAGITFFPLITSYIDNGAANNFGARLNFGAPGRQVAPVVDASSDASADANFTQLMAMPQFPFFNCPTRGFRVSRNSDGSANTRKNCDYGIIVSDTMTSGANEYSLRAALCPGLTQPQMDCWTITSKAGRGILNIAIGRERMSQAQYDALPSIGQLNTRTVKVDAFTNMIDIASNIDGQFNVVTSSATPQNLRFQRPYEGWSSRTRAASVPDGLSMTAVLAEKHLSARELGTFSDAGWHRRSPDGSSPPHWGNDQVPPWGVGNSNVVVHAIRGIAFGPGDQSNAQTGPTMGSWHPGNNVNVLMADGAVRTIGSDIDTLYTLPMLGVRNDTEIRSDGRLLTPPW